MANTHSLDLESSNSQYAYASDSTSLAFTTALTIEMWVKFESLPTSGQNYFLMAKDDMGINSEFDFWLTNSSGVYKLVGFARGTGGTGGDIDRSELTWTPSTGTWYHLAMTVDLTQPTSTTFTFYINGTSQGNGTPITSCNISQFYNTTATLAIGSYSGGGSYFDGLIDEVRVWNVVRSASNINTYKDQELTGSETGLVGYWKLNGNYNDSTSNGNNLTSVNSPVFSTDVPFGGMPMGGSFLYNFI